MRLDPFAWYDPFEALEIGYYAQRRLADVEDRWAERLHQQREQHLHETAALRNHLDYIMKLVINERAFTPTPVIITSPEAPDAQ